MEMSCQVHFQTFISAGKNAACAYRIGDWVCHRADMDALKKRKVYLPDRGLNPNSFLVRPPT
jgi:hypothetical protein